MKPNIIILRGVAGSGKSSVAELFANPLKICCADDYFTDENGNYNFDPHKLKDAHAYCRAEFDEALNNDFGFYRNIVVANTNTKESDWKYYEDRAKDKGCKVFFIVVENRHGNGSIYGVPEETLDIMEERVKNSLKLR